MQKPVFNVTRGTNAAMQMEPPFTFDGVSMRVLPLRANPDTLQSFVNRYLNICPDEVGEFRAYVPYVYLMVLDYGRMSVEQSNAGWIAQREIAGIEPLVGRAARRDRQAHHSQRRALPHRHTIALRLAPVQSHHIFGAGPQSMPVTAPLSTLIALPVPSARAM